LLTDGNGISFTLYRIAAGVFRAYSRSMREKVCKTCLVEHDEEIHAATLSLHQWLREMVTPGLREPAPEEAAA
jgi:hypothetical protein